MRAGRGVAQIDSAAAVLHSRCVMTDPNSISSTVPDWSREAIVRGEWDPAKRLLAAVRRYQRNPGQSILSRLRRVRAVLEYRFWSVVCGAEIPLNGNIGGGLMLPHPQGVIIHPEAEIGPNCLIFQGVTIGKADMHLPAPKIGGHVDIGAGAKILGDLRIGDHARIGANAVVLIGVPGGASAVGVPAVIKRRADGA